MKKISLLCVVIILFTSLISAQIYRPYTSGTYATGTVDEITATVKQNLKANGIQILGEYTPANDPNRRIVAFSSPELKSAVKKVGGLTGFAAVLRVAITKENESIIVSYNTPFYWGNAYFRKDYNKVENLYIKLSDKLQSAMEAMGGSASTQFGSKNGKSPKDLQNYKYKILMPHFDNTEKLAEFGSYEEALAMIDNNLKAGIDNIKKVYSLEFPDQQLKLYGIGMDGEKGEANYINKIDNSMPKHTAFFPYEMLVIGNEVHMLHGRYRIAISFPDLGMGRFMKIKSAPGNIKDMMKSVVMPLAN
jgi:uncharacterized protein (DUF302 family)